MKEQRRLSEGTVTAQRKKQRDKDGNVYYQDWKWLGRVNVGTVEDDGTVTWQTKSKVFSRVPCKQNKNGSFTGINAAKAALKAWKAELEDEYAEEFQRATTKTDPEAERIRALNVRDYMEDYLSRRLANDTLEKSTANAIRGYLKHYEFFGDTRITDITKAQLRDFKRYMLTAKGGERLSYATRSYVWAKLSTAISRDIAEGILDTNPLKAVTPPERGKTEPRTAAAKPLTRESLDTLKSWFETQPYNRDRTAFELALRCGLRRGEVCGLRFEDVDEEHGILHVRRAIGSDHGHGYVKSTKTQDEREIPLSPKILAVIDGRRKQMENDAEYFGVEFKQSLYVVGEVDGSFAYPPNLTHAWTSLSKQLDLQATNGRRATMHSLRHSFVSFARAFGVADSVTQDLVGHHSLAMTDHYTGPVFEQQKKAMELLDGIF